MDVIIYKTFDDDYLTQNWKEIAEENDYFVQNSYEWCSTWWKYFSGKNRELYIISVMDEGNILGIAPMFIERRFGFRQLRFIGTGLTDFHQILIRKDVYEKVLHEIINKVLTFEKWDLVYMDQVNDEDPLYEFLSKNSRFRKKHRTGCIIIDIDGLSWDEYINNINSNKLRKEYLRKSRKLERETNIDFTKIRKIEDFNENIESVLQLHVDRWSQEGENSKFMLGKLKLFVKEVFSDLIQANKAVLYVLKDGQTLVSYRLGFLQNQTFFGWNTSFNVKYAQYSPGNIITGYVMKDIISKGYKAFNHMRGDYDYKRDWMLKDRKHISNNYLFLSSRNTLRGWFLEHYYLFYKDRIKKWFGLIIKNKIFRTLFGLNRT